MDKAILLVSLSVFVLGEKKKTRGSRGKFYIDIVHTQRETKRKLIDPCELHLNGRWSVLLQAIHDTDFCGFSMSSHD